MSDDKNLVQRGVDAIQRFWPVSLFLGTLTLISRIEDLESWSKGLSFVIEYWREIMQGFWEFLVNFLRRLVGLPKIEIASPWPEILTFATLLVTSFRVRRPLDTFLIEAEKGTGPKAVVARFFGSYAIFLSIAASVYVIWLILPKPVANWLAPVLVLGVFLLSIPVVGWANRTGRDRISTWFSETNASFWIVCTIILVLGFTFVAAAHFTELLAEYFRQILSDFERYEK